MARKFSSLTSNKVAIDRELATTGYDIVKSVADKLTEITRLESEIDNISDNAEQTSSNLVATNQDTIDTAADLVATNQDTIDTASDLVETNQDTIDTAADVVTTNNNVILVEADKNQTGLDRTAVANDLVSTNQDTIDTAADVVATNNDVVTTNNNVILSEADKVQTGLDRIAVAAYLVLTHQDTIDTALDLSATNADVVATNADVVTATYERSLAENARDAAELAYDNFDDRYLGAKSSDPTLDNDGDALVIGALYFNSVSNKMQAYSGSLWGDIVSGYTQTQIDDKDTAVSNTIARNSTLNQEAVTQGKSERSGFSAAIYTGDGADGRAINTGLDMSTGDFGGLVWAKSRSADSHHLFDTIRGNSVRLRSDTTDEEGTVATTHQSFTPTGFTVGTSDVINGNAETYASWSWQTTKKVTGTTNRNKAYTSHYNPDLGFSIVGYEGDGAAGHEIPHHLGVEPDLTITKGRDTGFDWLVQSKLLGDSHNTIILNTTGTVINIAAVNYLVNELTVSIGSNLASNQADKNYVSYHFTSVPNVSKIGKYIGTGAAGNYVDCGFKPAFVMVKNLTNIGSWETVDSQILDNYLRLENSGAQVSQTTRTRLDDNGFYIGDDNGNGNDLNDEYLFMAYAESSTGGAGTNTYTNSDYTYPTTADTLSIAQNTLISFAQGFDANGQVDSKENVGSGVTYALGAGHESKHYYIYKDLGGSYGVTENRPLEGITRNDADKWGVVSPLDASLRTTARHFGYESSTGAASASVSLYPAWNAFNKNANDQVVGSSDLWLGTSTTNSQLQYKGTEARVLKSWRLRAPADNTRLPKRFTIEGSNDGFTWTAIDSTFTSSDYSGNGVKLWGDLYTTAGNTTAYIYHRINNTANNGAATYTGIAELEFNTILPSDYYLIDAGRMYNSSDTAIERTYLAEFRTDSEGDVINSTLVNMPVAKQRFNNVEAHGDLTVHGEIKNTGVATAWVNFDGTQNPPLILASYNVSDVVDLGTGKYQVIFEVPFTATYSYSCEANRLEDNNSPSVTGTQSPETRSIILNHWNSGFSPSDPFQLCLNIFGGKE